MAVEGSGARAQRVALQIWITAGGSAALSWEVLWQIESSLALGVSALGTAITLATTMAGMTVGALLAGRILRSRAPPRPAHWYGRLELLIGVSGLAMPAGFALLESLDAAIWAVTPSLASGLHMAGIALMLGPPSVAMGATVPVFGLLARAYGIPLSRLYGLNTAGAALGAILLAFFVVPALGLRGSVAAVAGVNLLVCVAMHVLRPVAGAPAAEVPATLASATRFPTGLALLIAFSTGFATFGLEVAWFRSLRAAFQSASDSFAIILASVLIPLAIGARLVPRVRASGIRPGALLIAAGVLILLATPLVERIDLITRLIPDPGGADGYPFQQAARLLLALGILGPSIMVLGIVLPWLLDEFGSPERVGLLYATNTAGAVCGSLLGAWVLLPWLGFARTAWLLGTGVLLLALLAASPRARRVGVAAGVAALVTAVLGTSSLGRDRVQFTRWQDYRILAYDEGPDSTVSVVEDSAKRRMLVIDGFATAAENMAGAAYMTWMGRLPMLLHDDPREALVICFGTGQTADGVRDEGARALDVVDLNPVVFRFAPHFETNGAVLEDPVVRQIVMDGRAWLRRNRATYDVITLEPMAPNFAGVNALYSLEFYEILAGRLRPGGIAAQWLPLHLLPPYYAASVTRTFQQVFPDAILWVAPDGTGIVLGRVESAAEPLASSWPGFERPGLERPLSDEQVRRRVTGSARWGSSALGPRAT